MYFYKLTMTLRNGCQCHQCRYDTSMISISYHCSISHIEFYIYSMHYSLQSIIQCTTYKYDLTVLWLPVHTVLRIRIQSLDRLVDISNESTRTVRLPAVRCCYQWCCCGIIVHAVYQCQYCPLISFSFFNHLLQGLYCFVSIFAVPFATTFIGYVK